MRWVALIPLALAGCNPSADSADASQSAAGMADAVGGSSTNQVVRSVDDPVTEPEGPKADLTGRWVGPEGLFAEIGRSGGDTVRVTMQYDLDHRGTFAGTQVGDTIRLMGRPGGPVTLTRGSGAQTGMKWVDPAADCLTAIVGQEAYCRPLS